MDQHTRAKHTSPNTTRKIDCKPWSSRVEYPSCEYSGIKGSGGNIFNKYSKRKSWGRNIPGGEVLQYQNELLSERLSLQLKMNDNGHKHPSNGFYPRPVLAFRYCRCLCLSARPSVPQSVCPSVTKFVRAITHYPLKLGSPKLDVRCKRIGSDCFGVDGP